MADTRKILTLEELIPIYYSNKSEFDSYKKICDSQNTEIKKLMADADSDVYTVDKYTAKISTSIRESTNEDKLLAVLKKHGITDAIKTKEYVDMDALEDYLYNNVASTELADDINACIDRKEIKQLRVSYRTKEE